LVVTGSTASASAVTVSGSGTMLGGTGTIAGTISVGNGSILQAGNAATVATGTLTTGALTLQSGSTFNAILASNSSISTLSASGTTTLSNAAFSIILTSGASFTNGTVLELITSAISGTFTNTNYYTSGYDFAANYTTNPGDFDVTVIAVVPEPATWLGGFLLVGVVGAFRRRQIAGWVKLARCCASPAVPK
jgi:hypothetical protein